MIMQMMRAEERPSTNDATRIITTCRADAAGSPGITMRETRGRERLALEREAVTPTVCALWSPVTSQSHDHDSSLVYVRAVWTLRPRSAKAVPGKSENLLHSYIESIEYMTRYV